MSWIGSASGDERTASAVIRDPTAWRHRSPAAIGLRAGRSRTWREDALLDARDAPDLAERLVAAERVGDLADGGHDRLDEADPPGRAS